VLALGFGFELLCEAYGIHLPDYGERGPGAEKMEPTTEGTKLFQGSDPLCISKGERWRTDEFPKKLQVLARSKTGVEAVKHKTKPLYGLQQRPEDFIYFSDAKIVYENIFSAFDKSL
jgi:anthranilate/para-aminobenzoate synthase component II